MNLHEPGLPAGFHRLFELFVCFAGESNNHICCERRVVQPITNHLNFLKEPVHVVPTPHPPQHRVRTALQSRMELRAQVFAIGSRLDEVFIHFGRFNAGEPHPPVARNFVQLFEQVPQPERRQP